MKAIIQESEILAALTEELTRDLEPDYPLDDLDAMPESVQRRLEKIVGMALQPEEDYREDVEDYALALLLRTDPVIMQLFALPWQRMELYDKFGAIVLYF